MLTECSDERSARPGKWRREGHASLTMTMRYAHLAPGHLRAEVDKTAAAPPVDPAIAALGDASVPTRRVGGRPADVGVVGT